MKGSSSRQDLHGATKPTKSLVSPPNASGEEEPDSWMKRPSLEEKTGKAATPTTSGISVTPSTLGILQTPEVPEILEAPFARLPPGRLISLGQQKTSTDTSDIPSSYEEEEAQPKQLPSKMSAPNAVSKHHLKKPTTSGKPNKQRELPATLPVSEPKQQVLNFAKAVPGSAPAIKDSPTRDFLTAAASRGGTASMSYKDLNCITDDDYWQAFINTVPDDHSPRQPFVIRFRYVGDDSLKGTRDYLLKHFITEKMEFPLDTITDIIQEPGSKEIDVCLESQPIYERFWAACKRVDCFHPDLLHGFEIVPLFRGDMKVMTVALRTTAIPAEDIAIWIKRHADLLMGPHKIKDSYGCWTGSGQQSVTGVTAVDDSNSYWRVRGKTSTVCERGTPVKCGQSIRLTHINTGHNLHSHHFTSPLSGNQEVSAFGEDGEGDFLDDWTVLCSGTYWDRGSEVRFKHTSTEVLLSVTGEQYGRPINGQREVHGMSYSSQDSYWKAMEGIFMKPSELLKTETSHAEL